MFSLSSCLVYLECEGMFRNRCKHVSIDRDNIDIYIISLYIYINIDVDINIVCTGRYLYFSLKPLPLA